MDRSCHKSHYVHRAGDLKTDCDKRKYYDSCEWGILGGLLL